MTQATKHCTTVSAAMASVRAMRLTPRLPVNPVRARAAPSCWACAPVDRPNQTADITSPNKVAVRLQPASATSRRAPIGACATRATRGQGFLIKGSTVGGLASAARGGPGEGTSRGRAGIVNRQGQRVRSQADLVAGSDRGRPVDAFPVDERPVGGVEVLDEDLVPRLEEPGMPGGNHRLIDHPIARRGPADHELLTTEFERVRRLGVDPSDQAPDVHRVTPEVDQVVRLHRGTNIRREPHPVDERAVGRVQVLEEKTGFLPTQPAMAPGDRGDIQDQITVRSSADDP